MTAAAAAVGTRFGVSVSNHPVECARAHDRKDVNVKMQKGFERIDLLNYCLK